MLRSPSSPRFMRHVIRPLAVVCVAAFTGLASGAGPDVRAAIASGDCKTAGDAVNSGIERNDPEALYFAGYLYDGTGCVADDPARAARFFRRAADLGYADAAMALGTLYGLGRGVTRDYAEADRWFVAGTTSAGSAAPLVDRQQATVAGYAMTVVRVAFAKMRYPRQMEKDGVTANFDAVFVPATGTVAFRNIKAGIAIGSNVSRSFVFTQAVGSAYADAIAGLPRPDVVDPAVAFVTPWHFTMLRSDDESPTKTGGVTVGSTTAGAAP